MILLAALIIASLLVLSQSVWKSAIDNQLGNLVFNFDFLFSMEFIKFVFSLKILAGLAMYGVATLIFFYALSKYNYFQVQSVVVASSIILTFLMARFYFGEDVRLLNVAGMFLIIIGTILVIKN